MPDQLVELVSKMSPEEIKEFELQTKRKEGENYTYLILYFGEYKNEDKEYRDWRIIKGRQEAYDAIKNELLAQDDSDTDTLLDISKSYVIAQPPVITDKTPRITFDNMLSIYSFMSKMLIRGLVVDDSSFSIEEYYDGE